MKFLVVVCFQTKDVQLDALMSVSKTTRQS